MTDMLLGISPEYLYLHGKSPKKISDYHNPYFLAFCPKKRDLKSVRKDFFKKMGG